MIQIGDIVICHRKNDDSAIFPNLILGHKYIIRNTHYPISNPLYESDLMLEVEHLSSGKNIGLFSINFFTPLSQYREEQITKILG